MLHGHTCHFSLRLSVLSLAFSLIGCKMTCCGSSLSRSRFASIDMRMVHGDLARDSGLERSVGGPAERVRGRLPLSLFLAAPFHHVTYVSIYHTIGRSVEQGREGGGVSVRG